MKLSVRTLVVAAHPDDEVLGCGGTMARIAAEGGVVQALFLADGESSRYLTEEIGSIEVQKKIEARMSAAKRSAKILGSLPPKFANLPDNRLDTVPILEIVKVIEGEVKKFEPLRVITHFPGDLNIDHQIVSEAVSVATRPQGTQSVDELLYFEVPSSTEWAWKGIQSHFQPNFFIGVDEFASKKFDALSQYQAEMRDFPHPRSVEGIKSLMKWRGASCNLNSAESFLLARGVY